MPKIDITYNKGKEEYELHASGWFLGSITFNNNPKTQIKKIIKDYGYKDE